MQYFQAIHEANKTKRLDWRTGAVTASRRRRRLTMYYYALMSQQSNWSATEGRAFERRYPES